MTDRLLNRINSRTADAKQWLQRVTELSEREEWDLLKHECYNGAAIFQNLNDDTNEIADREEASFPQPSES